MAAAAGRPASASRVMWRFFWRKWLLSYVMALIGQLTSLVVRAMRAAGGGVLWFSPLLGVHLHSAVKVWRGLAARRWRQRRRALVPRSLSRLCLESLSNWRISLSANDVVLSLFDFYAVQSHPHTRTLTHAHWVGFPRVSVGGWLRRLRQRRAVAAAAAAAAVTLAFRSHVAPCVTLPFRPLDTLCRRHF